MFTLKLKLLLMSYFNSIKVQLELKFTAKTYGVVIFQFHKGTIRTIILLLYYLVLSNFNSIKVQLELAITPCLLSVGNFNSIKVQLEPFHHYSLSSYLGYFNSIKVQLELYKYNYQFRAVHISIP